MQRIFLNNYRLIYVLLLFGSSASAQQNQPSKDSTGIYKDIESYSKRNRLTRALYNLIFKEDISKSEKKILKLKEVNDFPLNSYKDAEGKIIRSINIVTLDPFGYSIHDESVESQNFLYKAGNKLHVNTQHLTIRNLLLIHSNQVFDSLLVKESERLIRSQRYVHDVSFYFDKSGWSSDSVDIYIRELDNWSIIPDIEVSSSRIILDVTDKNILGLGHEFENAITWFHSGGKIAFNTNYIIPNFKNTYISGMLHYGIDEFKNFTKSIQIERPFFSPFARWAAGILISQQFKQDSFNYNHFGYIPFNLKFNTQDYWLGKAQPIFEGKTENERTTNLILAGRVTRIRYLVKLNEQYDSLHVYSNEDFYLASIGISTRKYVRDRYIFNYGITEDVPIGMVYNVTGGYQYKNHIGRYYFGIRYSTGNFYDWGYLSRSLEYGTFINGSHVEQGTLTFGANYFTRLISIGNWKVRQFVKPQLAIGISRFAYDSLTFHEVNGLDGFNSKALTGTNRFLLTFQTQTYSPWYFLGFRFGPYFNYSIGLLGDDPGGFRKSRLYSVIGLGVLVKNENLVINTFQFSFSFYPLIPGNGEDLLKFNSFQTTNFGFRDFEIGKPGEILFR